MNTILLRTLVLVGFVMVAHAEPEPLPTKKPLALPPAMKRERRPTPEQKRLLETGSFPTSFGDDYAINPVIGSKSHRVKKVEGYLNGVVSKLEKAKPFKTPVKIKIFITEKNEFDVSSRSSDSSEKTWAQAGSTKWHDPRGEVIDREWPIRRWMNV